MDTSFYLIIIYRTVVTSIIQTRIPKNCVQVLLKINDPFLTCLHLSGFSSIYLRDSTGVTFIKDPTGPKETQEIGSLGSMSRFTQTKGETEISSLFFRITMLTPKDGSAMEYVLDQSSFCPLLKVKSIPDLFFNPACE